MVALTLTTCNKNNRLSPFAFIRTNLVLRSLEMFRPYHVYRQMPSSLKQQFLVEKP